MSFIETLQYRNEPLFWAGTVNLGLALLFFVFSRFTETQVLGINAWIKPFKFALSIGIFLWTMAWYGHYLKMPATMSAYSWGVIVLLGIEIIYIALQAARGQLSHFNVSTPFYANMYMVMAFAASAVTIWTGYLGALFFSMEFPELSASYLWAIRLSIVIFVVFSFEGFVMGSRMSHTIGGPDGGPGLPILNWSLKYGDPRVSHFIGMHALQVLPFIAYYVLKDVRFTMVVAALYFLLAGYTLVQALAGKPVYNSNSEDIENARDQVVKSSVKLHKG